MIFMIFSLSLGSLGTITMGYSMSGDIIAEVEPGRTPTQKCIIPENAVIVPLRRVGFQITLSFMCIGLGTSFPIPFFRAPTTTTTGIAIGVIVISTIKNRTSTKHVLRNVNIFQTTLKSFPLTIFDKAASLLFQFHGLKIQKQDQK
ncbi:hypothetical protein EDD21DRAFT_380513 [Dissophora ornata]|nr:hypothetical protein EDD21DRAFT_380513 [Dissophora ornata]